MVPDKYILTEFATGTNWNLLTGKWENICENIFLPHLMSDCMVSLFKFQESSTKRFSSILYKCST